MLERIHVVAVPHAFGSPRDIDVPVSSDLKLCWWSCHDLLSQTSASAAVIHVTFWARRVETTIHVNMYGDV